MPETVVSQRAAVVHVDPADVTLSPGDNQMIEIWVDDVEDLWAFDIDINFDPTALMVSELEAGGFLSTEEGRYQIIVDDIDPDLGLMSFDMTQWRVTDTDPLPRNGSGALIRFQVTAKNYSGETDLILQDILLSDRDGIEIPASAADGKVNIFRDGVFVYLPMVFN